MFDEAAGAVEAVSVLRSEIDAQGMVQRRDQIVRMHGVLLRESPVAIRFAVDLAGPHSATGD